MLSKATCTSAITKSRLHRRRRGYAGYKSLQILSFSLLLTQICVAQPQLTWTTNGPFGPNIREIVIGDDSTAFAQTDAGVFRSMNNGNSWTKIIDSTQSTGGISIEPTSLLVGVDNRILRSTDNGTTWEIFFTDTCISEKSHSSVNTVHR